MKDIWQQLGRIRYYAIYCAVVFGVLVWAQWQGYKLIGDDNDSKEQAVGNTGRSSHFYHK